MHKFRDLAVYKKALLLTKMAREYSDEFPISEKFGLTSQFRRAVDLIVLNIAEGAGNSTQREFGRFLNYSIRSGFECLGCCDIALINSYGSESLHDETIERLNEVIAMLYGLRKSLGRV